MVVTLGKYKIEHLLRENDTCPTIPNNRRLSINPMTAQLNGTSYVYGTPVLSMRLICHIPS